MASFPYNSFSLLFWWLPKASCCRGRKQHTAQQLSCRRGDFKRPIHGPKIVLAFLNAKDPQVHPGRGQVFSNHHFPLRPKL